MGFVADKMTAIKGEARHGRHRLHQLEPLHERGELHPQKLARAALGTNNIDNCSRVCHSPTSLRAHPVARRVGRHELVRRHRRHVVPLPHRREPDRGPSGRRRAHEGGSPARREAHRRRSAPHRARRDGRRVPPAPPGHERRALQRPRARHRPRRPRRSRVRRRAHRPGFEAYRRAPRRLRPEEGRGDHRRPGGARREGRAPLRVDVARRDLLRARRHRAGAGRRRACAVSRTSRSSPATSASRARGSNPLRGQNNVQGSSDVGALPTYLTMYREDGGRRRPQRVRGAMGRHAPSTPRAAS